MRARNFTHRILFQLIIKIIGLRVDIINVFIINSNITHTETSPKNILSFITVFCGMFRWLIQPSGGTEYRPLLQHTSFTYFYSLPHDIRMERPKHVVTAINERVMFGCCICANQTGTSTTGLWCLNSVLVMLFYSLPFLSFSSQYFVVTLHKCTQYGPKFSGLTYKSRAKRKML